MTESEKVEDIYYGLNGEELSSEKDAYVRKTEKSFYVMEFKGALFKKGTVVKRLDVDRMKWRKVGPHCFANYLEYLKTNKEPRYLIANRNPQE